MEIEVYKDVSKRQKTLAANMTLKQWAFIAVTAGSMGFGALNALVLNWVPNNIYQPISFVLPAVMAVFTLLSINGIPFERWIRLWAKNNFKIRKRYYSLERNKKYTRNDFKTKEKETL